MYEFLVLGQLSRRPMHGYMIAKIVGNMIGPFRQVQWGALYPLLSKLQREGLVQEQEADEECEGRVRKVYGITEEGRTRLHEHLMDTSKHQGEYDSIFAYKVAFFSELSREQRLHLSRHYAVYAQQNLDHLHRKQCALSENAAHLSASERRCVDAVMSHRIQYWETERQWAEELISHNYNAQEAQQ